MIYIICITIIICIWVISFHKQHIKVKEIESKLPQSNCYHEIETFKAWNGTYSDEYLSTCKKCGYQKQHFFGNN